LRPGIPSFANNRQPGSRDRVYSLKTLHIGRALGSSA
jgi:hypothetical protein